MQWNKIIKKLQSLMDKKVYLPKIPYTHTSASILILMHIIKNWQLNELYEIKIWKEIINLPLKKSNPFSISVFLESQGIKNTLYIENPDINIKNYKFLGYRKKDIKIAKLYNEFAINEAKKHKIRIVKRSLKFYFYRKLANKYITITRLNTNSFFGYDQSQKKKPKAKTHISITFVIPLKNETFIIYLSKKGKLIIINKQQLRKAYNTVPAGKHFFITVKLKENEENKHELKEMNETLEIKDNKFFNRIIKKFSKQTI